ncbi:MAG TPA: PIG-L family deacetylase [Clostridiaceae bacterium]|nr:PIG-L family deacetylase [Clostridiaceae bacterium]
MKILAVIAHPHYAGIQIAGTIINHVKNGDDVYVVSLTSGDLMTDRVPQKELAEINKKDAEESAKLLGIKELRILDFKDSLLYNSRHELRLALNEIIREIRPEIVITHWPNDTHPDFRETGLAVIDACFYALLVAGVWAEKYPSHMVSKLYSFETPMLSVGFEPDVFVDISDVVELKTKSMEIFKIHIDVNAKGSNEIWNSSVLGANRRWGTECGVMYAEPYKQIKIHEVHNRAVKCLLP